jgi:release factor glutamine methyltransferase
MTVREALQEGQAALAGSETPFLDASLILADLLSVDRARLLASVGDEIDVSVAEEYRKSIAHRAGGLPVAYILGYKEFYGRRFAVDSRVLVPRPDTETLVETALRLGDDMIRRKKEPSLQVYDVCTGSGCVAISIAAERPQWKVTASDISPDAVELARMNAETVLDPKRTGGLLEFVVDDLLVSAGGGWDLVVANPPYVESSETDRLLSRGWSEPRLALDGGPDGLDLIRRLIAQAAERLAPGGALALESDASQADAVSDLFRASRFSDVRIERDLAGRPRVTTGRKLWTS